MTEPVPSAPRRRHSALVWSLAALLVGVLLSFLLAREHSRLLKQQDEVALESAADRVFDGLSDQLETCGVLIRALQTLFTPPDAVSPDRFAAIYVNLRPKASFPGLIAMAYSRRERAPDGELSYPTELVAPLEGNERVLGLDVTRQPGNLSALERSRDSGEPALSESFRLVQRATVDERADGITLRLPVYRDGVTPDTIERRREHFTGSLAVSFRVSELIANAMPQDAGKRVEVRVTDVTDTAERELFSTGSSAHWRAALARGRTSRRELRYGGRHWRVELGSATDAVGAIAWVPWITFGGGLLASILLALWLRELGTTRERALTLAGQLSARYRDSEARFRALNELLPVAVVLADARSGAIVYVNQSGRALLGQDVGSERTLANLFEDPAQCVRLTAPDQDEESRAAVTRMLSSTRAPFWASVALSQARFDGVDHLLAVIADVTQSRELTDRLSYQASHDALTGLYNRREFERQLEAATRRETLGGHSGALLYLDLDQFKLINDTSGHVAGDQLLAGLGAVLRQCIGERDVLARLGGDEFGILLDSATEASALALAERVRQTVDGFVFSWEGKSYALTTSIGIVMIHPHSAYSLRELLSLADTACYMAKERGRSRIHLFSENDLESTRRRSEMEWASRLRQALAENRFSLHYQEIRPLRAPRDAAGAASGAMTAAGVHIELLLRLRDEHGELLPAGAFEPAAERYNLMPQLDRWVLETALAGFERLHPQVGAVRLCSINLSGATLDDEKFPDFVIEQLQRHQVSAERLCFEITETAAADNLVRVVRFIERLREVGCRFALDDFGAGMSSFGYLKNLPLDFIKIDGSFIRELETDPMSYSIVRAVTEIGHQSGVAVVAECVATSGTIELLRGLRVDHAQGDAVHEPAPTGLS